LEIDSGREFELSWNISPQSTLSFAGKCVRFGCSFNVLAGDLNFQLCPAHYGIEHEISVVTELQAHCDPIAFVVGSRNLRGHCGAVLPRLILQHA
jgi:hypothetical protein